MTTLNVNSGVTIANQMEKYIVIWHTEEFQKVLIHELVHFYQLEKLGATPPSAPSFHVGGVSPPSAPLFRYLIISHIILWNY